MDADLQPSLPPNMPKGPMVGPMLLTIAVCFALTSFAVHLTGLASYVFSAAYAGLTTLLMFRVGGGVRRLVVLRQPQAIDPPWRKSLLILSVMVVLSIGLNLIDRYLLAGFYLRNGWLTPENIERFLDASLLVRLSAVVAVNGYFSARLSYQRMTASLEAQGVALQRAAEAQRQQREAEASQQRAESDARMARQLATEAELTALKMQINPHFLFNTLGSIAVLARIDGPRAGQMTEKLAEIFRYALQASKQPTATLGEEIAFLRAYFEIEQARFGARLHLTIDVPESLKNLSVPNLLLQPMVENAVVHAFKDKCAGWNITVRAEPRDGSVAISVSDNGRGFGGSDPYLVIGRGTALKNIDERLRLLHGEAARLAVEENTPRGAVFTVRVPLTLPAVAAR
jgi:signal transduction histidine kinase